MKKCVNVKDWTPVQHTPNLFYSASQKAHFFQKWCSLKVIPVQRQIFVPPETLSVQETAQTLSPQEKETLLAAVPISAWAKDSYYFGTLTTAPPLVIQAKQLKNTEPPRIFDHTWHVRLPENTKRS